MNYQSAGLEPQESLTLKVKGAKGKLKWSTSNKKIASVSKKGKVTAKAKGTALIKAKAGKKTYTCKVTVAKRALNQTSLSLPLGQTFRLVLSNPLGTPVWSSSNPGAVFVGSDGLVRAKAEGTAVISALCNKKTYSCTVTAQKEKTPNPGAKINIMFTNQEIETLTPEGEETSYQSLESYEETVTVFGEVNCEKTQLERLFYELKDSLGALSAKGELAASAKFELTAAPGAGTNTLTIWAEGTDGTIARRDLTIVRYSKSVRVSDQMVGLTEEETAEFVNCMEDISYQEKEETVNGNTLTRTYVDITLDSDTQFVKDLKNGRIKSGDVVFAAEEEKIPTGFTGVVVKYETAGERTAVTFRAADFADVFCEDGCIEMSEFAEEDAVAFAITPAEAGAGRSAGRAAAADDYYDRSVFPEGFSVTMAPKVSLSGGALSVGMDFGNIILYDKDRNKSTAYDRINMQGSIGMNDLKVDAKLEWNKLFPQQIRFDESYETNVNLKISAAAKNNIFSFPDVVKQANGEFENKCEALGVKVSGIDMKDKLLLAVVGIHLKPRLDFDIVGMSGLGGYAKKIKFPIAIAALYLDINGNVSGQVSLSFDSATYTEHGFNLYGNSRNGVNYRGVIKPDETKELGGGYVLDTYSRKRKSKDEYGKPSPVVTLDGKAEAGFELAVGGLVGVMVMGIVPADAYMEFYSSTEVDFEGKWEIKLGVTDEGLKQDNTSGRIRLTQETGLRVGYDFKIAADGIGGALGLNFAKSDKKEFKLFEVKLDYPKYTMQGTVSRFLKLGTNEKEPLGGADFKIYEKEKLDQKATEYTEEFLSGYTPDFTGKSNGDGTYDIYGMGRYEYVVLVTYKDHEPYIETVNFNGDIEKMITLTPLREENWLDVCQPWKYSGYGGETYIGDGRGSMKISGVDYEVGFYLDGGDAGTGNSYAYWNLGGKFSKLKVRIGHLDASGILTAELNVFLDGAEEPSQTIPMDPKAVGKEYEINLNYADTAVFQMKRGSISNWAHAQYGFVEGVWYTESGVQGTVNKKDPFENADWDADFMTLCPPFLVHAGDACTKEEEKTLNVAGETHDSGFVLNTNDRGFAVFHTNGKFRALKVRIGMMADSARTYATKARVYLDGEAEASEVIDLKASAVKDVMIPLRYAKGVRIELDYAMDPGPGSGATYGFVNGEWVR